MLVGDAIAHAEGELAKVVHYTRADEWAHAFACVLQAQSFLLHAQSALGEAVLYQRGLLRPVESEDESE